jgi:hypothetical protein
MGEYRVTFGQRFRRDPHPRFPAAHPDGYVTIHAADEHDARRLVVANLGGEWAFLYGPNMDPQDGERLYPMGELAVLGYTGVNVRCEWCRLDFAVDHPDDCLDPATGLRKCPECSGEVVEP